MSLDVLPLTEVEGVPFAGIVARFDEGDLSEPAAAVIDWGDGSTSPGRLVVSSEAPEGVGQIEVRGEHTYRNDGVYVVNVRVTGDEAELIDSGLATVAIQDPTLTPLPFSTARGTPPGEVVVARLIDPNPFEMAEDFEISAVLDGERTIPVRLEPLGEGRFDVVATFGFGLERPADGRAELALTVIERSPVGTPSTITETVPIVVTTPIPGTPPGLLDVLPLTPDEGVPFSGVVARFAEGDLSRADAAVIDWGDGSISPGRLVAPGENDEGAARVEVRGEHTYRNDGVYVVNVRVTGDGGELLGSGLATVAIQDPTLTPLPFSTVLGMPAREIVVARLVDPNPFETAEDFEISAVLDGERAIPVRLEPLGEGHFDVVATLGFGPERPADGRAELALTVVERTLAESPGAITETVPIVLTTPAFEVRGMSIEAFERAEFVAIVAEIVPADPAGVEPEQFRAVVDWGDGSEEATAVVSRDGSGRLVVAGSHTYARPGVFPIEVRVTRDFPAPERAQDDDASGFSRVVSAGGTATVSPRLGLSGGLSPSSRTGTPTAGMVTRLTQPSLSGTARPLSVVELFARRPGLGPSFPIGRAVASNAGTWELSTPPMLPGAFEILARETMLDGTISTLEPLSSIVIDTSGPRVLGVVFDPRTRRVGVSFADDLSGLDLDLLLDPGNYSLIGPPLRRLASSGVMLASSVAIVPSDPSSVIVSFPAGAGLRRLPSQLRIRSDGIRDLAGNALDGRFDGRFPSGDGFPGGDFITPLARHLGRLSTGPAPERPMLRRR